MVTPMLSTYGSDRAYWYAVSLQIERARQREDAMRIAAFSNNSGRFVEGADGRMEMRKRRNLRCNGGGLKGCKRTDAVETRSEGEARGWWCLGDHWYCPVHKLTRRSYGGPGKPG